MIFVCYMAPAPGNKQVVSDILCMQIIISGNDGLLEELRDFVAKKPTMGTCAGTAFFFFVHGSRCTLIVLRRTHSPR